MFITVSGQKGGVPKTCTSLHLAAIWSGRKSLVCVVDADRNRSALAYVVRGELSFPVVPVEAATKATRQEARQAGMESFGLPVFGAEVSLLAAPATTAAGPIPAAWSAGPPTAPLPRRLNA